jgi:putative nucleotidyltransferase with HDIG domain
MALSALEELSRRGIRVPEDIAVTGFDNIDMSGYSSPSLTTVRTPLYEMGWAAAKRLQDILDGKDGVPRTYISSRMVIRESCRCLNSASNYLNPPLGAAKEPVTPAVEAASRQQNPVSKSAVVPLMKGPLRPIGTGPLEIPGQSDFWEAQRQLSELWYHHRKSGPIEGSRLESENQIFQSIMEVSRQAIRSEWTRIQGFIRENIAFDLIRTLIAISNVPDQMENIAVWLPLLGIPSCYLSLYREESGKTESVCIFGCHDKNRLDVGKEGTIFPTKNLVPDDFLANGNRRMLIVESLGRIGFVVFEMQPGQGRLFNMISYLIGGALQSALLFQELQEQKNSLSLNLEHMRKVMAGFISTISATVEAKDPYTSGHQQRVSDLARSIAQQMNLPPMQVEAIRMAGIVHDLGKIYIPAEILNRPSKLDDIEWNMIKKHPKVAYDILKNIDFPWPIAEIVYQHHERLNGSGYPRGLQSDQISLESKIIAVADVVEAMSSRRPYREPLGLDKALEEVTGKKGVLYDMDAVNACAELFRSKGYRLKTEMFPTFAR